MQQLKSGEFTFVADGFVENENEIIAVTNGQESIIPKSIIDANYMITDYTPPAPVPPVKQQVPQQVDIAQARLALLSRGLLDRVGAEIEAMEEPNRSAAKIEWEFRITIRRDNHLVLALGALLGLSADDLDDLFIEASKL